MKRTVWALSAAGALILPSCSSEPRPERVTFVEIDGRPSALTTARGVVLVADDENHVVHVLDENDGEPVREPIQVERNPIAMDAYDDEVWVGHASGALVRIDRSSLERDDAIDVGGSITGVDVVAGSVWVTDHARGRLIEIDASEGTVEQRITVPDGAVRVAVARDRAWVSNNENTVSAVDVSRGKVVETVEVGGGPIGLFFDGENVSVANSDDGTVSVIDESEREVIATYETGRGPVELTDGGAAGVAGTWVVNQDDASVTRIGREPETIAIPVHPRDITDGGIALWIAGTDRGTTNRNGVVRVLPG